MKSVYNNIKAKQWFVVNNLFYITLYVKQKLFTVFKGINHY